MRLPILNIISSSARSWCNFLNIPALLCSLLLLTSCFTGIESTKTIRMSKGEAREALPTPEEQFLAEITAMPHPQWPTGRLFVVTDSKASLLMDARKVESGDASLHPGDTIRYVDSRQVTAPDGRNYPAVSFERNGDLFEFSYRGGAATGEVKSDDIPGVVDLPTLEAVNSKLQGNRYWTLSKYWDDAKGNRMEGKKYIPVTILEVMPGTMAFPYKVKFRTGEGAEGYYLLKLDSNKDSHTFGNMFSFSDPRKRYPGITDEVWNLICRGEVKPGMTKDEVRISRGLPSDVRTGHDYSRSLLIWAYPDGTALYFEDGILTGINNMK